MLYLPLRIFMLPLLVQRFSKIEVSHAYAPLIDDEIQEYLTINTYKGLYSYKKLPYGVKSSPNLFPANREMWV